MHKLVILSPGSVHSEGTTVCKLQRGTLLISSSQTEPWNSAKPAAPPRAHSEGHAPLPLWAAPLRPRVLVLAWPLSFSSSGPCQPRSGQTCVLLSSVKVQQGPMPDNCPPGTWSCLPAWPGLAVDPSRERDDGICSRRCQGHRDTTFPPCCHPHKLMTLSLHFSNGNRSFIH